jgi:DNA-binding transcriptional MerR regulator
VAKSPEAFRTISEAAEELDVPQHVLRFWETKFSFIRPMKRAGGRRFYRPQDLAVLKGVRRLLHDEGFTIKGVQKLHKEQGMRRLLAVAEVDAGVALVETASLGHAGQHRLWRVLEDLEAAKAQLDEGLGDRRDRP